MRQNAYTFRTAYYNSNDTKVLNKKIVIPPALKEYTPSITFRNNFATPAMSAMRGTLNLPGLKPVDVANNSMVGFNFTLPVISDIGPATMAGRPVKTTTTTVTVGQLNTLPVDHLIAIATQLAYFPASPARDAFAPILYKLLQDAVNTRGAYGMRNEIIASIDLLVGVFPVVAVAPVVAVPGGGVLVPGAGAPVAGAPVAGAPVAGAPVAGAPVAGAPGGVAPVGVAPVAGAPAVAPVFTPSPSAVIPPLPPLPASGVLSSTDEIDRDIHAVMLNSTFTDKEILDIADKIQNLTDAKVRNRFMGYFQDLVDTATIYKKIIVLNANGYGDPPVLDILRDIKTINEAGFRNRLEEVLNERMKFLGIAPPSPSGVKPPVKQPDVKTLPPPGAVPGEEYKDFKQLFVLFNSDKKEYNKFMNSFDKKSGKLYYATPKDKTGNKPLHTPARDEYVKKWINPAISQRKTFKQLRTYITEKITKNIAGDPEGILSNKRGFIHNSMR